MSRLWNAIGQRYEDAVAVFAAAGRLVEYDESGAVVTVNGEERLLEPATLVTAAMMMAKNGVVAFGYTGHSSSGTERAIGGEEMSQEASEEDRSYTIWYAKDLGANTTVETLSETHEVVATVSAHELEHVFELCNTDPVIVDTIAERTTSHTSMSVGDVAFDGDTYWLCTDIGWEALPQNVVANGYTGHSSSDSEGVLDGEIGDELDTEVTERDKKLAKCEEARPVPTPFHSEMICEIHAEQLAGWDEVWCPLCASTAGGEEEVTIERRQPMTFHDCSVLNKRLFAGPDGYCRRCRSVELAAQILNRREVTGPTFEELLNQVGGEEAYRASLEDIRHAKHNGRPGNAVKGRVPREILNLIMTQHPMFINDLLEEYRAFAGKYGIALRHDPDGVLFHDYAVFAPVQPALPAMVPALNGNTLRDYAWQANVAEKRAMRSAFVESVRTSRQIVMSWVSSDGTESGMCTLGPNTQETRLTAAEYQAAALKKGFRTRFSLVQG